MTLCESFIIQIYKKNLIQCNIKKQLFINNRNVNNYQINLLAY
jgi:hypothetical protein